MQTMTDVGTCPVATTISLIDGKWKVLILRDLLKGPRRYSQLKKSVGGISQKMLTQSLRQMQANGLVNRTARATVPPQVTYSLTALGESMRPIIAALRSWGLGYMHGPYYKRKLEKA